MKAYEVPWTEKIYNRINHGVCDHLVYVRSKSRLHLKTLNHKRDRCYLIVGPSRVGKTGIVEEFELSLNINQPEDGSVYRPVIRLNCRNRDHGGTFTIKTFFLDALVDIEHPFYEVTGVYLGGKHNFIRKQSNETTATLQAIFENALAILGTKYLILDEAQHLRYVTGGDKTTLRIMEFFKTLAEKMDLTLIFVGAYPVVDVLQLSPHILGRLSIIEMPRYIHTSEESLIEFHNILDWYSEGIEFEEGVTNLRDWNRELYDGSLGVIGLLAIWLREALDEMRVCEEDRLSLNHLKIAKKKRPMLDKIAREILDGEKYMENTDISFEQEFTRKKSKTQKSNNRPFQSTLKRRKVGSRK